MKQYHDLLVDILENGESRQDRTGVGTISVFGRQLRFNLKQGFPAITTKKLAWRACVGELLWFLEGSGDERRLAEITHGTTVGKTTIWTPNATADYWQHKAEYEGDLGRVYGVQWRRWRTHVLNDIDQDIESDFAGIFVDPHFKTVDQVANLVRGLREDPQSRRHIISAWNVGDLEHMALPPCHVMSQYYVNNRGELSCHMYQRSQDVFLGAPFNYASYALLTHMLAQVCGYGVSELIVSTGDSHIYKSHIEQVKEQLTRKEYPLPRLWLNPAIKEIDRFTMEDIKLQDYQSHDAIRAKMAV